MAGEIGTAEVTAIPVSALTGDNLTRPSEEMAWYTGPTLLSYLETVDVGRGADEEPFRMPVQYVNRPNPDFRGYCGRVAAGTVAPGERVRIMPSGVETRVESIVVWQGTLDSATRGDSVALTLEPDVDVSRGDVVVHADDPLEVADQFQARILWMGDTPLLVGRPYLFKLHATEVGATVTRIRHRVDVCDGSVLAAEQLELNDLGVVNLATSRAVPFAPFEQCRELGAFVLLDRVTNAQSERDFARSLFEPGDFMEIFVDASLEVCARRDPKGLYAKAMKGEIRNFTGVDSPYEKPDRPDLRLDTEKLSPEECAELVMRSLDF